MISLEIVIDNLKVNYKVSGKGKNVLLIHGWGASIKSFEPVHNYLEKNFCTYSIDLPGFGESQEPPTVWAVEQYADLVGKFLDQLDIDNPILVGHSFGGKISIYLSAHRKVNKVILIGSTGIKPKENLSTILRYIALS